MIYWWELDSSTYIFVTDNVDVTSISLTQLTLKAIELGEITQVRRSRSFKVNDVGTNRKLVQDFLLVNNTNLYDILHRFQVIAECGLLVRFSHFNREYFSLTQSFGANFWAQDYDIWCYGN